MTVISPRSWSATWWPFASSPSASGGSMATSVRGCIASASTVVSVTLVRDDCLVVRAAGVELADLHAAERERGEAGVDRVGHVVAVDAVVALVGYVHHVAVGPDAARAVVAGPAQLAELLVADALEFLRFGVFGRVLIAGVRLFVRQHGQAVGEEPLRPVVGDPHGHAVGPDAARVVVGRVELVLGEQFARLEVVGEERVGAAVQHPHRLLVGPDAARITVLARQLELALLQALPRPRGRYAKRRSRPLSETQTTLRSDQKPRGARFVSCSANSRARSTRSPVSRL